MQEYMNVLREEQREFQRELRDELFLNFTQDKDDSEQYEHQGKKGSGPRRQRSPSPSLSDKSESTQGSDHKRRRLFSPDYYSSSQRGEDSLTILSSEEEEEGSSTIPSKAAGWMKAPTFWQFYLLDDEWRAKIPSPDSNEEEIGITGYEFRRIISETGPIFYIRNAKTKSVPDSPYRIVSSLTTAIAALATYAMAPQSQHPVASSIKGQHKANLEILETHTTTFPSFIRMKEMWQDTAYKRAIPPPSADKNFVNNRHMDITWPVESEEKIISDFLGATKVEKRLHHLLSKPEDTKVKKDVKARKRALQLHNLRGIIDTLHLTMKTLTNRVDTLEQVDLIEIIKLNIEALAGISNLVNPLALTTLEDAVECRISLREATIPTRMKLAKRQLLAMDPFHPEIAGSEDKVETINKTIPVPAQLTVPDKFFKSLKEAVKPSQMDNRKQFSNSHKFKQPNKPPQHAAKNQKQPAYKAQSRQNHRPDSGPKNQSFPGPKNSSSKQSGNFYKKQSGRNNPQNKSQSQ